MKKINYLLCGLLSLAMVACSDDEPNTGTDGPGGENENSFIALNIVNSNSSSRATETETFEYGTDAENAVKNARCYFFKEDGTAFTVTETGGLNYSDFNPVGTKQTDGSNVAVVCKGTVVMSFAKSETNLPKKMVVVLNIPKGDTTFDTSMSLTELKDKVINYTEAQALKDFITAKDLSDDGLLMTNSVYVKTTKTSEGGAETSTSEIMCEIPIDEDYIKPNIDQAEATPLTVYVERVAAKMTLDKKTGMTTGDINNGMIFPVYTSGKESEQLKINDGTSDKEVYAKILGFCPTVLTDKSYILKKIDTSWDNTSLGITTNWNNAAYFRCYWATSATPTSYLNPFSFTELQTAGTSTKYCLENTDRTDMTAPASDNRTKLLIAAQLMDGNGEGAQPIPLAEWNGSRYLLPALKVKIASLISKEVYIKTGENAYSTITEDYIDFKPVDQTLSKGRYAVTPLLKAKTDGENPADITYYKKGTEENTYTALSAEEVAQYNTNLGKAPTMIWNNGYCYYYVDNKHFGSSGSTGEYGVVRNHVYKTLITQVVGTGTPVYDPDLVIIPETPDEKYSYIAAEINILGWHIVSNDVVLGK